MRYDWRYPRNPERWTDADELVAKNKRTQLRFAENPEKRRASNRRWFLSNSAKSAAASKAWRNKNPEKVAQSQKRYREQNRDKILASMKQWRADNPGKRRTYGAARRAKVKTPVDPVERRAIAEIYSFCAILNALHKKWAPKGMFNVDHVRPLSRGGEHKAANLRVTTAEFNRRKYAKV